MGILENILKGITGEDPAKVAVSRAAGLPTVPAGKNRGYEMANMMGLTQKTTLSADELLERMKTLQTPSTIEGQKMLSQMKEGIEKYSQIPDEGQTNISPILAASDFWSGTNYMKDYKTPNQIKKNKIAELLGAQGDYVKSAKSIGDIEKDFAVAQMLANMGTSTQQQKPVAVSSGGGAKAATTAEKTAALFANNAYIANNAITQMEAAGFNPGSYGTAFQSALPNFTGKLKNADVRSYQTYQKQFVNAVARPETGAAIKDDEMDTYIATYFGKAGDPPELIQEKAALRQQMIDSLIEKAGPAYRAVPKTTITRTAAPGAAPVKPLGDAEKKRLEELRKKAKGG